MRRSRTHREALKGIVATLVAMAGLAGLVCTPRRAGNAAAPSPPRRAQAAASRLNPRRGGWSSRWRAGFVAALPPAQPAQAEGHSLLVRDGVGTGIVSVRRAGSGPWPIRSRRSRAPPAFLPAARSAAAVGAPAAGGSAAGVPRIWHGRH